MKKLLFVGLLFITSTAFGQIIETEDEFTGQTAYRTSRFSIQSGDVLEAKGALSFSTESGYLFNLYVYDREFQHMGSEVAFFLIDGEREQISVVSRDSDYEEGGRTFIFQVQLGMNVDEPFLKSIANADRVRFKIGEYEYEFSLTAKINVQMMLDKIQETKQD